MGGPTGEMTFGLRLRRVLLSEYVILALGAGYYVALVPVFPEVRSTVYLSNLLLGALPLLVLAVGQMFVLLTGGIDLSIPAVVSLASVLGAKLMLAAVSPLGSLCAMALALAGMALFGVTVGIWHGLAVAVLRMPAFLVTLASLLLWRGVGVWLTGGVSVSGLPAPFLQAAQARPLGLPAAVWLAGAVVLLASVVLQRLVIGQQLRAVGHNLRTAAVSGIPVSRTIIFAYAVCGFCAAAAALLYLGRLTVGKADLLRNDVLLDCIGAAVIGGTSLRGGKGSVTGVVLGVGFFALLGNSLDLFNLAIWHVQMAKGAVILLAALLDSLRQQAEASR